MGKYGNREYTRAERIEAFWEKVNKSGNCWEWLGVKNSKGYGYLKNEGHMTSAHRFVYELKVGPIGVLHVCHHCDNPGCVNPDHLFLGTQKDNMQDCVKKGRINQRGEKNNNCKLTDVEVMRIRERAGSCPQQVFVAEYGMSSGYISEIIAGLYRRMTNGR